MCKAECLFSKCIVFIELLANFVFSFAEMDHDGSNPYKDYREPIPSVSSVSTAADLADSVMSPPSFEESYEPPPHILKRVAPTRKNNRRRTTSCSDVKRLRSQHPAATPRSGRHSKHLAPGTEYHQNGGQCDFVVVFLFRQLEATM